MEKKRMVINTAVCDARNVSEAVLESYDNIQINAATVLVSRETNELISRYNVSMNASEVIEVSKDAEVMIQNGTYEISDSTILSKPVILVVNGTLDIKTSSQEVLEKFISINVNGVVTYPSDIQDKLPVIKVNGTIETYPSDAVRLKSKFIMDKIFIMRAKSTKYYASRKVVIPDENLNISPLVNNGARFITKKAVIAESLLEEALPLFDEDVEIEVIPSGYKYVNSNVLTDGLIRKYGDSLYVDGDMTISLESENALNNLSRIKVNGNVLISNKLKDRFIAINPEYKDMKTIKGIIIEDRANVTIDKYMFDKQEEGITVIDCGVVFIKDNIAPEEIEEKLQFIDCGFISCSEKQKYAVELVSEDVGHIGSCGKGNEGSLEDMEKVSKKDTKVINTAIYTM